MAEQEKNKEKNHKNKHGAGFVVRIVVLAAAIAVFCYAAYQLYTIYHGYRASGDEYDQLKSAYTSSYSEDALSNESASADDASTSPADTAFSGTDSSAETMLTEDAPPPLSVDFTSLQSVNPDVAGWLYIDAIPSISYPICHGTDNEYYLHHTFEKEALFPGAIFADHQNSPDFSDPNTLVYGHNMKDQSMFGKLKMLRDQTTFDAEPYFWILTPEGSYRYHIFAAFETPVDSDAYLLYSKGGSEFLAWENEMQKKSEVKNSVALSENDKTVILSTCTSDSATRCVVIGKCVSSKRP